MTISANDRIKSHTGDGSTVAFSYDFPITSSSEISVVLLVSGTYTTQTLTTHYSVTIAAGGTGTITFVTAPASGSTIFFIGVTPITQTAAYVNADRFPAASHEGAMDKIVRILQEHEEKLRRSAVASPGNTIAADDVATVAGAASAITTVSDNIADVNTVATFADTYTSTQIGYMVAAGAVSGDIELVADEITNGNFALVAGFADETTTADITAMVSLSAAKDDVVTVAGVVDDGTFAPVATQAGNGNIALVAGAVDGDYPYFTVANFAKFSANHQYLFTLNSESIFPQLITNGDMASGNPNWYQASSPTPVYVSVSGGVWDDYGIVRALEWPNVAQFAYYDFSVAQTGRWMFAAFIVESDATDISGMANAVVYEDDGTGTGLTGASVFTNGAVSISSTQKILYSRIQVGQADTTRIYVGYGGGPAIAGNRKASNFALYAFDYMPSIADALKIYENQGKKRAGYFTNLVDYLETNAGVTLTGSGSGSDYVLADDGVTKTKFKNWLSAYSNEITARTFDIYEQYVGTQRVAYTTDDTAPLRIIDSGVSSLVAAGHGWPVSEFTATGHGLTTAIIGTVFSSGGVEAVITSVPDANTIRAMKRTTPEYLNTGTWTDGTNSFTATVRTNRQFYPVTSDYSITNYVNGEVKASTAGTFSYSDAITIMEVSDILPYSDIVSSIEAGGVSAVQTPTGTPNIRITNGYGFDRGALISVDAHLQALDDFTLDDWMAIQAGALNPSPTDGTILYYVPRTLPVTHESTLYDFTTPTAVSGWSSYLNFVPATYADADDPPDRFIQLTNNYGMAIGYLPLFDAEPSRRAVLTTVKAGAIANTGKAYPVAVDIGNHTVSAGTGYHVVAYRVQFAKPTGGTTFYPVRSVAGDFLFADWHTTGLKSHDLPADYLGRSFDVIRQSPNVRMLPSTNALRVVVDDSQSWGEICLRFR